MWRLFAFLLTLHVTISNLDYDATRYVGWRSIDLDVNMPSGCDISPLRTAYFLASDGSADVTVDIGDTRLELRMHYVCRRRDLSSLASSCNVICCPSTYLPATFLAIGAAVVRVERCSAVHSSIPPVQIEPFHSYISCNMDTFSTDDTRELCHIVPHVVDKSRYLMDRV